MQSKNRGFLVTLNFTCNALCLVWSLFLIINLEKKKLKGEITAFMSVKKKRAGCLFNPDRTSGRQLLTCGQMPPSKDMRRRGRFSNTG